MDISLCTTNLWKKTWGLAPIWQEIKSGLPRQIVRHDIQLNNSTSIQFYRYKMIRSTVIFQSFRSIWLNYVCMGTCCVISIAVWTVLWTCARFFCHLVNVSLSCNHWGRPKVRCIVEVTKTRLLTWSTLARTNLVLKTERRRKEIRYEIHIIWIMWWT